MTVAGFYGDDFTGSVDALLQFRRAGLSGVLVTGPGVELDERTDVVGIAGTARSLPTEQMAAEVVPALRRLRALGPRIVQYKACSTADSAPHTGSIGRVLELAVELFPEAPVPIVFAQPDAGRYTFFGHHFARDDGVVYRLDRQPTMSSHPVTPVHESDLRRHLSEQTALELGSLHWPSYDGPVLMDSDEPGVVCDAISDEHLDRLAQAILESRGQRFVIGSGGISGAIGRRVDIAERLPPLTTEAEAPAGPTLVLNGSRSRLTRRQVDAAAAAGWFVLDLFAAGTPERVEAALAAGAGVLVDSSITRRTVPSAEVEDRLAAIADLSLRQRDTRLVLSGGDTSGNVLRRLGVERLRIVAQPWGNVALCQASGPDPHLQNVELVLKGGQMGHVSLFDDIRLGRPLKEAACSPTPVPALTHE
ncbi:four-carbon acid sugar kinase family protein [Kribbella sp. NBC_00709]|uniref:four-carbon acid sugar kinase family protein n=1 Tax=Kribbella sp. NBC_00709 TaxID=2975972 RepID=UPI002E2BAF9F|nr:four-carbon acid sugar kinase family protein [Kribbella sp. NBC_00709]